jgi:hypothetical protein
MTLTEVMVYCTLLSLFSLMLFVNLPNRGNATSEDLRAAASKADTVLEKMTLELGNASATSVTSSKSPTGIMFLSASGDGFTAFQYTTAGELAWHGWVGYFQEGDSLLRVWYPFKSGVARSAVTTTPSPSEMLKVGNRQVMGNGISALTISVPEANLWQIELKLAVDGSETTLVSGAAARN